MKHKRGVNKIIEEGRRFILMRRWKEDLTSMWIEQYFEKVDVAKLTKDEYNCIVVYRKMLYFAIKDDEKVIRGKKIGYVLALSLASRYSSADFTDVDDIIFEEFMEDRYLPNEVEKMEMLYSTVDRKRGTTRVWMVGNSISKINPYIQKWGLNRIILKQKQGDIDVVTIHNEENDVKIAIEYCKSSGGKQMAISNKMIDKGIWQSDQQPKLEKSLSNYSKIYTFGFFYKGFKFLCDYIMDNKTYECVYFIKPYYKDFDKKTIVFSDKITQSPYWKTDIYTTNFSNNKLNNLFKNFREDSIFFSDDITGTDFKQAINFFIRR